YMIVRDAYGLRELWQAIEELDNKVPTSAQTTLYLELRRLLDRAVRWLVTNHRVPLDVNAEIARLRPGLSRLLPALGSLVRGPDGAAVRPVRRPGRAHLRGTGVHVHRGGGRGAGHAVGARQRGRAGAGAQRDGRLRGRARGPGGAFRAAAPDPHPGADRERGR